MRIIKNPLDSEIFRTTFTASPWEQSKRSWELVNEKTAADDTKIINVKANEWDVSIVDGFMNDKIWESLPLLEHQILSPTKELIGWISNSMGYLLNFHADLLENKTKFLRTICLLELKEERREDATCITSVTVPNFPFTSFFSVKAGVHIPPSTVVKDPSLTFFAENMYHEIVHNIVNVNLLENEIFIEDYDSRISPKVNIPWRAEGNNRNRSWEMDRVYHALIVYINIIPYRLKELQHLRIVGYRKEYEIVTKEAINCAKYLFDALRGYFSYFTALGIESVKDIDSKIEGFAKTYNKLYS